MTTKAAAKKSRVYAQERNKAVSKRAFKVAEIREMRDSGALGDDVFKLAQAMILCTLPYRPTATGRMCRFMRLSGQ